MSHLSKEEEIFLVLLPPRPLFPFIFHLLVAYIVYCIRILCYFYVDRVWNVEPAKNIEQMIFTHWIHTVHNIVPTQ